MSAAPWKKKDGMTKPPKEPHLAPSNSSVCKFRTKLRRTRKSEKNPIRAPTKVPNAKLATGSATTSEVGTDRTVPKGRKSATAGITGGLRLSQIPRSAKLHLKPKSPSKRSTAVDVQRLWRKRLKHGKQIIENFQEERLPNQCNGDPYLNGEWSVSFVHQYWISFNKSLQSPGCSHVCVCVCVYDAPQEWFLQKLQSLNRTKSTGETRSQSSSTKDLVVKYEIIWIIGFYSTHHFRHLSILDLFFSEAGSLSSNMPSRSQRGSDTVHEKLLLALGLDLWPRILRWLRKARWFEWVVNVLGLRLIFRILWPTHVTIICHH